MSWRGLVAVVALLAAGIVGGFATADQLESSPSTSGAPKPVTAQDPSFPIDPTQPVKADPPQPALGMGLPMRQVSVGAPPDRVVFPAPRGWSQVGALSNQVKYKVPNNPNNTFILRVEQVTSDHESTQEMVQGKYDQLRDDETQVKKSFRSIDQLEVSYVHDNYRRFALYSWIDVRGSGQAEVEIAITGRKKDLPGIRELMTTIIRGMDPG